MTSVDNTPIQDNPTPKSKEKIEQKEAKNYEIALFKVQNNQVIEEKLNTEEEDDYNLPNSSRILINYANR